MTTPEPLPKALPLLALRSTVVFPRGTLAVQMGAADNVALLRDHPEQEFQVVVAVAAADDPSAEKVTGRIGVLARVRNRTEAGRDTVQVTLDGMARVRLGVAVQREPYPVLEVEAVDERLPVGDAARLLMERVLAAADTLLELNESFPAELPGLLGRLARDPSAFADLAASRAGFKIADRDEAIQRLDVSARLEHVASRLEKEVARAQVLDDVKRQTDVKVEQHHREFYLRQQLQAIRTELGERDPHESDAQDLLRQIEAAALPEQVASEARRETERLRALSPASSEYQVLHNYIEWVLALPWSKRSGDDDIALNKVEQALDDRHYGLEEAKERILEYLSVRKLLAHKAANSHGPILCFVGPPGTGKTSLGEAIAASIGVVTFAGSQKYLNGREVSKKDVNKAMLNELRLKLSDPSLSSVDAENLSHVIALYANTVESASTDHETTLHQLLS